MKKVLTIAFLILVVAAIVGAVAFFVYRPSGASTSAGTVGASTDTSQVAAAPSSPSSSSAPFAPVPAATSSFSHVAAAPTSSTITIGTSQGLVTVNNFYKNAQGALEQFIIIAETSDYEITYDVNTSGFYLSISKPPFATGRGEAESAFLSLLGIGESDACKLSASEGAAYTGGDAPQARMAPLSFCASSTVSAFSQ